MSSLCTGEISGPKGDGDEVCETYNQTRKTRGRVVERRARRQGHATEPHGQVSRERMGRAEESIAHTYASRYG